MFWLQENLILMKEMSKKCLTDQRFILFKEITYLKIHTLTWICRLGFLCSLKNSSLYDWKSRVRIPAPEGQKIFCTFSFHFLLLHTKLHNTQIMMSTQKVKWYILRRPQKLLWPYFLRETMVITVFKAYFEVESLNLDVSYLRKTVSFFKTD